MRPETNEQLSAIEMAVALVRGFIAGRTFRDFESDALLRSGVERQLQVVGQRVAQLSESDPNVAERIPEAAAFIKMRDLLNDRLVAVDATTTWKAASEKLEVLADALTVMFEEEEAEQGTGR